MGYISVLLIDLFQMKRASSWDHNSDFPFLQGRWKRKICLRLCRYLLLACSKWISWQFLSKQKMVAQPHEKLPHISTDWNFKLRKLISRQSHHTLRAQKWTPWHFFCNMIPTTNIMLELRTRHVGMKFNALDDILLYFVCIWEFSFLSCLPNFCVADQAVSSEGRLDLLHYGQSVLTLTFEELHEARGLVYLPKRDIFLFSNSQEGVETAIYALKINTTHINSSTITPLIKVDAGSNQKLRSPDRGLKYQLFCCRCIQEKYHKHCPRPSQRWNLLERLEKKDDFQSSCWWCPRKKVNCTS